MGIVLCQRENGSRFVTKEYLMRWYDGNVPNPIVKVFILLLLLFFLLWKQPFVYRTIRTFHVSWDRFSWFEAMVPSDPSDEYINRVGYLVRLLFQDTLLPYSFFCVSHLVITYITPSVYFTMFYRKLIFVSFRKNKLAIIFHGKNCCQVDITIASKI